MPPLTLAPSSLRRLDARRPARRLALGLPLVCLLAAVGCEHRRYELDQQVEDGKLHRKLTAYVDRSGQGAPDPAPLSPEELAEIAKAYGVRTPDGGGPKHTFEGRFPSELPSDVGGRGEFVEWNSEFGAARIYVERFRGDDDLVRSLALRRDTLDRLVDLLTAWCDKTWADQAERAALHEFLDKELRHDLLNLVFYVKVAELTPGADDVRPDSEQLDLHRPEFEPLVRAGQYLLERDYLTLENLPAWSRAFQSTPPPDARRDFLQLLQNVVRKKIGLPADQPLPPSLALLGDPARLSKSLNDFLRDTDEYRAKLAAWEQMPLEGRPELPPEAIEVLAELAAASFGFDTLFERVDTIHSTLSVDHRPLATNGNWDESQRRIVWTKRIPNGKQAAGLAPGLAYACWASPDEAAQAKRLGASRLVGHRLLQYCLWRKSLTPAESRQWSKFVETWTGQDDLVERIDQFRFDGEEDSEDRPSRSNTVLELFNSGDE